MKEKELLNLLKWFEAKDIILVPSEFIGEVKLPEIESEWIIDNLIDENIKGVKHEKAI